MRLIKSSLLALALMASGAGAHAAVKSHCYMEQTFRSEMAKQPGIKLVEGDESDAQEFVSLFNDSYAEDAAEPDQKIPTLKDPRPGTKIVVAHREGQPDALVMMFDRRGCTRLFARVKLSWVIENMAQLVYPPNEASSTPGQDWATSRYPPFKPRPDMPVCGPVVAWAEFAAAMNLHMARSVGELEQRWESARSKLGKYLYVALEIGRGEDLVCAIDQGVAQDPS